MLPPRSGWRPGRSGSTGPSRSSVEVASWSSGGGARVRPWLARGQAAIAAVRCTTARCRGLVRFAGHRGSGHPADVRAVPRGGRRLVRPHRCGRLAPGRRPPDRSRARGGQPPGRRRSPGRGYRGAAGPRGHARRDPLGRLGGPDLADRGLRGLRRVRRLPRDRRARRSRLSAPESAAAGCPQRCRRRPTSGPPPAELDLAYAQSWSLCRLLAERYGAARLERFYRRRRWRRRCRGGAATPSSVSAPSSSSQVWRQDLRRLTAS